MGKEKEANAWQEVYALIRRIPAGRVMNYGQIAGLLVRPLSARAVGWALRQCPDDVPWHRVVNSQGGCSTDAIRHKPSGLQRALLEAEGIRFGTDGRLPMEVFRWTPE